MKRRYTLKIDEVHTAIREYVEKIEGHEHTTCDDDWTFKFIDGDGDTVETLKRVQMKELAH